MNQELDDYLTAKEFCNRYSSIVRDRREITFPASQEKKGITSDNIFFQCQYFSLNLHDQTTPRLFYFNNECCHL